MRFMKVNLSFHCQLITRYVLVEHGRSLESLARMQSGQWFMQRLIHKRWLVLGFMSTLTNKSKKYSIIPIPDKKRWQTYEDLPVLSPPTMKKGVGRPCRNQRREEGEDHKGKRSKTVKCKKRECYRHNARTCKGGTNWEAKKGNADQWKASADSKS